VENGLLASDVKLTCFSLTGYTGGGKGMIAGYESADRDPLLDAPRQYALGQEHKHLKEMKHLCGLETAPIFCPIVADFPCGMEVTVPLFASDVKGNIDQVRDCLKTYYQTGLVHYMESADEGGFLSASAFSGRDDMQVTVCGNDERMTLVARFDNLGKGASGAAVQNMNILLGVDESTGLSL
ncbi:MAG: N-acetyl-gamma-glutamyl-phosphate reductase, partial [Clostridia bacterium]|nr:N-acetyl-gamma-glutamyl-phosphate reductase [Clostridia bacterium]